MRDLLLTMLAKSQDDAAAARQDLSTAAARYDELRAATLEKVVRWEWTSSNPRYAIDPFHFLNPSARRGRASKREPAAKSWKHEYGFDQDGRIVASRQHTDSPTEFYEEFIEHSAACVRSTLYHYASDKKPINCTRLLLADGLPRSRHQAAQHGDSSDVYLLEQGRIRFRAWRIATHGREPWGACEELVFKPGSGVELWQIISPEQRLLAFSGDRALYDTMNVCA